MNNLRTYIYRYGFCNKFYVYIPIFGKNIGLDLISEIEKYICDINICVSNNIYKETHYFYRKPKMVHTDEILINIFDNKGNVYYKGRNYNDEYRFWIKSIIDDIRIKSKRNNLILFKIKIMDIKDFKPVKLPDYLFEV